MTNPHPTQASAFVTMAQKISVAAIDQSGGGPDKGDNGSAQSRCLPRLGTNARLSVESDSNLTIGGVVGVPIRSLHQQAETLALIGSHSGIAAHGLCDQHVPKPENGFEPIRQVAVQRQDDCGPCINIGFGEDQILNPVSGAANAICPLRSADSVSNVAG